jgi:hypothetical protein
MKAPPATAGFFIPGATLASQRARPECSVAAYVLLSAISSVSGEQFACISLTKESHMAHQNNNKPLWKVLVLVMAHIAVATLWFIGIGLGAYVLSVFVEWLTRETHVSRFVIKGLVGLENFVAVLDIILYGVYLLSSTYNEIKEFLKNENNDTGPGGDREE